MSLLMEALKKAEQEKLRLDANRSAEGRPPDQSVFADRRRIPPESKPLLLAGIGALLAFAGLGLSVWWQWPPPGGPTAKIRDSAPPPPLAKSAPPASPGEIPPPRLSLPAPTRTSVPQPPQAEESPLRISRKKPGLDPALTLAYEAFQTGDMVRAEEIYGGILRSDPNSSQALHGLAAVNIRRGQFAVAAAIYEQALRANSRDATAQAGLAGLQNLTDIDSPTLAEEQLKRHIADLPGQAPPLFALGNLYARQNRWGEAHLAYLQATALDPDNPDYLFNLAVSFDQLHQSQEAAHHYRMAMLAATDRPIGFDPLLAQQRLSELGH